MTDGFADFDIEEVRAARARERQSSRLVEMADTTVSDRVEAAIDAGADIDEDRAVELVTELADERAGKLIKLASFDAAGMPIDRDGMTDDEQALVQDLADRIDEWRASVVPAVDPDAGGADDGR